MSVASSPVTAIVPTLNDEEPLKELLSQLRGFPQLFETRVADGGSEEGSREIVESFGATWLRSELGRGRQMNMGAEGCSSEILWFLHADNVPHPDSIGAMLDALRDENAVGGAFRFQLSEPRWYGPSFHLFIGFRSKILKLPYGDQGFFVRREAFERLEGFSTEPILEDVDFIRRLRRLGKVVLLDTPIGVSPRRWDEEGVLRRTLLNWTIMVGYGLGIGPRRLERLYRRPPHSHPCE